MSKPERSFDLVVLGSGSAAFAAAIRARDHGASVALVESGTVGGTCVNVGCVPSKFLIERALRRHDCPSAPFDLGATVSAKDELVAHLRCAKYEELLERYEMTLVRGTARFADEHTVDVDGTLVRAARFIIATGARPAVPPIPGLQDSGYLTSTEVLNLRDRPARVAVIGGNAIGLELGQYLAHLGCSVTIVEALPSIAPREEAASRTALTAALEAGGIEIAAGARIVAIERDGDERIVRMRDAEGRDRALRADALLVATGRRPATAALALERAGVRLAANGAVITDAYLRTDNPAIFAAGDVTGAPQFVYVAAYQGALAAENALGERPRPQDLRAVPRVIFTQPRLAAVGETAEEAAARGASVEIATLDLGANVPRAIVNGSGGTITLVAEGNERRIIGVHMVGEHADEVILAATYVVKLGLTVNEIVETFHPYLTMGESLRLCAQTFDRDPASLSCCAT